MTTALADYHPDAADRGESPLYFFLHAARQPARARGGPCAVGEVPAGIYGHGMDLQHFLADISLKTMSQVHRAIVHLSGGQVLGSAFGMPVVELHTTGRTSGLPRSTMLTAPVTDGDRWCWWPPRAEMTVTRTGTATCWLIPRSS